MNPRAIQFRGADDILQAYENVGIPSFALLQAKDIIFSYIGDNMNEGAQELSGMLSMLNKSRSEAVYAIQLYKVTNGRITNKTEYDNRFQCVLYDDEQQDTLYNNRMLTQRVKQLEEQIAAKDNEDDGEESIGGIQGIIAGMLQKPEVQNFLLQTAVGIIGKIFSPGSRPAAMAGVPVQEEQPMSQEDKEQQRTQYEQLPAAEREKLDRAIGILLNGDPEVGTNLLKLATILQNDPAKYNFLSSMA